MLDLRDGKHALESVFFRNYCDNMKNIIVTVDDEIYWKARIKAAERDTSVSALVKRFLAELTAVESDSERLKREERTLRERIGSFRAAVGVSREDVHERRTDENIGYDEHGLPQ
jgi:hypothetical protein